MIDFIRRTPHRRAIDVWNESFGRQFPQSRDVGDCAGQMLAIVGLVHYMSELTEEEKREAAFQVAVIALQWAFDLGESWGKPVTQEEIDAFDADPENQEEVKRIQADPAFQERNRLLKDFLMLDFEHQAFKDALLQRIGEHHCVVAAWRVGRSDGTAYHRVAFSCLECGKHEFSYPETLEAVGLPTIWQSFLKRHAHA